MELEDQIEVARTKRIMNQFQQEWIARSKAELGVNLVRSGMAYFLGTDRGREPWEDWSNVRQTMRTKLADLLLAMWIPCEVNFGGLTGAWKLSQVPDAQGMRQVAQDMVANTKIRLVHVFENVG